MTVSAFMGLLTLLGFTALATALILAVEGRRTGRLVTLLALAGLLSTLVGVAGELLTTLLPLASRLQEPLLSLLPDYALETKAGQLALAIMVTSALATLLTARYHDPYIHAGVRPYALTLAGLLLLSTAGLLAVRGHASAGTGGTLVQTLHIAAGIGWFALVVSIFPGNGREITLGRRLERVSNIALALVVLLLASGILSAWLHGLRLSDLTTSRYGLLILAKSGLLGLALMAAAWNRFLGLAPRSLATRGDERLRAVLLGEAAIILVTVAVAATLARTMLPSG